MSSFAQAVLAALPDDHASATLAGRVWRPDVAGPSVVAIRNGEVFDITASFATMRDLCEEPDPAAATRAAKGESLGPVSDILANTPPENRNPAKPWLLAPIDLQAVKAAGVTFPISMLERVIEERARGDLDAAAGLRAEVNALIGDDLASLKPGSPEAAKLKEMLIARNAWSQYLEVGIGPDAEIFTKAQPMAAIGTGMDAGVNPVSTWNNPEPEVVLVVASDGRIVGATLGNDVNLRDVEGRSALLLSKAKDNNASAAVGPFIRFLDAGFGLDDIRTTTVTLTVAGTDNFRLEGASSMTKIARDITDLAGQMVNAHHRFPDGAVLFCGTMFAPIDDRDAPGKGFTHKTGDIVTIATPKLGRLVNRT
jgi:fumarylacetoacetate (FAA) hydrolase family protein